HCDLHSFPTRRSSDLLFFDTDQRQLFSGWIELGCRDYQPSIATVGNEGFLSGNDVVIAIMPGRGAHRTQIAADARLAHGDDPNQDRKSTRLNSSHVKI